MPHLAAQTLLRAIPASERSARPAAPPGGHGPLTRLRDPGALQPLPAARRLGPAVALTAYARSEDRTRALLAGFQNHVTKPIAPGELLAGVASLATRAAGG
jgi:CheY-like chemotaxis protein